MTKCPLSECQSVMRCTEAGECLYLKNKERGPMTEETIPIRVPKSLYLKIVALAKERDQMISRVVARIFRDYLAKQKGDTGQ